MKSISNVVILCGRNNLQLDEPEDIADGIIEIGSTFKRLYTNVNVLFVEFDPVIVTGLYVNEILKLKSVSFLFRYVNHDTN